jgi:hypothetical protein
MNYTHFNIFEVLTLKPTKKILGQLCGTLDPHVPNEKRLATPVFSSSANSIGAANYTT